MLGDEKLRLPRLPDEPPPPALAHTPDSRTVENMKSMKIIIAAAKYRLFPLFIFGFAPVWNVGNSSQTQTS